MDLHILGGVMTGVLMLSYVGIGLWAYSGRRREDFEQAARLPLLEDGEAGSGNGTGGQ